MPFDTRLKDGVVIIDVTGPAVKFEDLKDLESCISGLIGQGKRKLALNLNEVEDADFGVLIAGFVTAVNGGGYLKLFGLSQRVNERLKRSSIRPIFDVRPDEARAIGSYNGGPY